MAHIYKPKKMISKVPGKERTGYFATRVNSSTIDMERLCKLISDMTSMSGADVKGVVEALVFQMCLHIRDGHTIKIDGLGIFTSALTSLVVDSEKELVPKLVRIKGISFRPSVRLKKEMGKAQFVRQTEYKRKNVDSNKKTDQ